MEIEFIKYLAFIFTMVLSMGLLSLWLKSNKIKRKQKEHEDQELEIQKEKHRQAVKEKQNK